MIILVRLNQLKHPEDYIIYVVGSANWHCNGYGGSVIRRICPEIGLPVSLRSRDVGLHIHTLIAKSFISKNKRDILTFANEQKLPGLMKIKQEHSSVIIESLVGCDGKHWARWCRDDRLLPLRAKNNHTLYRKEWRISTQALFSMHSYS